MENYVKLENTNDNPTDFTFEQVTKRYKINRFGLFCKHSNKNDCILEDAFGRYDSADDMLTPIYMATTKYHNILTEDNDGIASG